MTIRAFLTLTALFLPTLAYGKGEKEAEVLASCAWQTVPRSAGALSAIEPRKGVRYDDVDAPTAPSFMRIYAACAAEKKALSAMFGGDSAIGFDATETPYRLLKALKKNRPAVVSEEHFAVGVYRCEARFADVPADSSPAKTWWGYGETPFSNSLASRATVFNSQVPITSSDLQSLDKGGDAFRRLHDLLTQGQKQPVGEFETQAEGMASGKVFTIKATARNSKCQTVAPNGELTDA